MQPFLLVNEKSDGFCDVGLYSNIIDIGDEPTYCYRKCTKALVQEGDTNEKK